MTNLLWYLVAFFVFPLTQKECSISPAEPAKIDREDSVTVSAYMPLPIRFLKGPAKYSFLEPMIEPEIS